MITGNGATGASAVRSIAVAAAVLGLCAGVAQAQVPTGPSVPELPGLPSTPETPPTPTPPADPSDPCVDAQAAADGAPCDTEFTPVPGNALEESEFEVLAGADFEEGDGSLHSPAVPYTVDFFTTAFSEDPDHGFFAGAQCRDTNTPFSGLDSCERVPAIYEYTVPPGQPGRIEQVRGPLATGESERGYVAEVAWITPQRAIAVGGTGHYPRREPTRSSATESDADYVARDLAGDEENAAGAARVWIYDQGAWQELENLPRTDAGEPMAGLITVDCSPRIAADGEFCVAGGMRQLWHWQGNGFTKSFTPSSTDGAGKATVNDGAGWRFRVRSVRFRQGQIAENQPQAIAVTSGCCGQIEPQNTPRLLLYQPSSGTSDPQPWESRLLLEPTSSAMKPPPDAESAGRDAQARKHLPDSYYALDQEAESLIATQGRDGTGVPEPTSRIIRLSAVIAGVPAATTCPASSVQDQDAPDETGGLCRELASPRLSSLRLLSGDGDFERSAVATSGLTGASSAGGDSVMDWAVGVLGSSGQGMAYRTTRRGPTPNPLDCTVLELAASATSCQPRDAAEIAAHAESQSLLALPTYALNSYVFTPGTATAWAAGDRGAVARLGGEGGISGATSEPEPPRLGAARPGELPGAPPYGEFETGDGGETGEVPPLAESATVQLDEPALIPAGVPDPRPDSYPHHDVNALVMSRDGSEGWALGGAGNRDAQGTVLHYTGGRWQTCDTTGIPGQLDPDRACAGLGSLHLNKPPVEIRAAARIPLELDDDPTNDEEFEVMAVGTNYTAPGQHERLIVLRYRGGSWSIDEATGKALRPTDDASPMRSVVFTSPDDGWVLSTGTVASYLQHYDGERWVECGASGQDCSGSNVLPKENGNPESGRYGLTAAGGRLYYYGTRFSGDAGLVKGAGTQYPFIFSLDTTDPAATWQTELDPGGTENPDPSEQGSIHALSVAEGPNGELFGWATGSFGSTAPGGDPKLTEAAGQRGNAGLLQRTVSESGEAGWQPPPDEGAAADYLFRVAPDAPTPAMLALPGTYGEAFLAAPPKAGEAHPTLRFAPDSGTWEVLPTPFSQVGRNTAALDPIKAEVQAMTPDGQGGFWLAARQSRGNEAGRSLEVSFYHYADHAQAPVFDDVPHPIREPITDIAPGPRGRIWAATASGTVYRYDRILGWDAVHIPGWDPGRVVTRASAANAVAIGPDGSGVVVGEGGRIANVTPTAVRLDRAAGAPAVCDLNPSVTPCGTGRALVSAAVAPDGSAMVGGEARALLYRPASGEFASIAKPPAPLSATFTDIAMPAPGVALVTTDTGQVFRGEGSAGTWTWTLENRDERGRLVTVDGAGQGTPLNALAVDASGRGYAVGRGGMVIARTMDGAWHRVDSGIGSDLYSVALPAQGRGEGVLIGGELGQILTVSDGELRDARGDDITDPLMAGRSSGHTGRVVGLALQPGAGAGDTEAWAATQVPGSGGEMRSPAPGTILHYSSKPSDPLMDGSAAVSEALPDAAPAGDGDLELAAFGRTDCHLTVNEGCIEAHGTTLTNEVVSERIADEIASGGPDLALFTGDVNRAAGRNDGVSSPLAVDVMHRRWSEFVMSRLAGVPLFGVLGAQDLSEARICPPVAFAGCATSADAGAGTTEPWQESFASQAAPWGDRAAAPTDDVTFAPVAGAADDGRAQTHYAADIVRGGSKIARLVVLDNSLRSLNASDGQQNPTEAQADFLRRMLCRTGEGEGCTRGAEQEAIVAMNTPSYSYEASASGGGVETATDQATLETLLLDNDADVVIAGRLGWNGLYYTLAPGLHCPGPGGGAPDPTKTPSEDPAAAGCDQGAQDLLAQAQGQATTTGGTPTGELPTVVASGAGGTFGPVSEPVDGEASQGFWHGYSTVHLDTDSGDVSVEQRPVFDWIGLGAKDHEVAARARLPLEGYGREVGGADTPLRYDELDSFAITHRYDLLLADPDQPWMPCNEGDSACGAQYARLSGGQAQSADTRCAPYLCLPERIGAVDRTTGVLRAGDGRYPETFALALLSVGGKSATYPLIFKKSPSFVTKAARLSPQVPKPGDHPKPEPRNPDPPQPPGEPPISDVPQIELPAVPVPPAIPLLAAASLVEPTPPAPPAPPPPSQQPAPLDLSVTPTGLAIAAPTALIQPPTPPVNPAPPGGARREARQRQAAAQKSGADGESEDAQGEGGVDPTEASNRVNQVQSQSSGATRLTRGRTELPATRLDRGRAEPSFTAIADRDQASAWVTGALYGGGVALMALMMSIGWSRSRPTPRGREPELPAPAWDRRR